MQKRCAPSLSNYELYIIAFVLTQEGHLGVIYFTPNETFKIGIVSHFSPEKIFPQKQQARMNDNYVSYLISNLVV